MSCNHLIIRISGKYLPYRYICWKCAELLKIASGVHISDAETLERITKK